MAVRRSLVLVLALVAMVGGAAQAADLGARAMGMGGAYTALANDATAVYWNPAGLAEVSVISVTPVLALETSGLGALEKYRTLTEKATFTPADLPSESFGLTATATGMAGVVTKRFGVSYVPSAKVSADYDYKPDYPLNSVLDGSATMFNDTVLTVALPFTKAPLNLAALNVGANLKFINGKYYGVSRTVWDVAMSEDAPPVELGATGNGFGLDLGAQGQVGERLRLGVVARDVVRNVSWSGTDKAAAETKGKVEPTLAGGLAFKAPLGLTVAADVENTTVNGKNVTRYRAGLEESLFGVLAGRVGIRTNPDGANPTYSVGLGAGIFKFLRLELAAASDLKDSAQLCLTGIAQF